LDILQTPIPTSFASGVVLSTGDVDKVAAQQHDTK
jgi:hypothetical protein